MIALFTDFGLNGPYIGQMQLAIWRINPAAHVVNLFADAPGHNVRSASYLLPAFTRDLPDDVVFVCVIDPGVGSVARLPIVATIDGKHFVGPDNGLFDVLVQRASNSFKREIIWQPKNCSRTFHGRDLFAPIAAHLDQATLPRDWLGTEQQFSMAEQNSDLYEIIYVDEFGNCMTGISASGLAADEKLRVGDRMLKRATTFNDVAPGTPFWYENSSGLAEIAVNCGNAAGALSLSIGTLIERVKL